jgi:hypothetical protein
MNLGIELNLLRGVLNLLIALNLDEPEEQKRDTRPKVLSVQA